MKNISLTIDIKAYDFISELPQQDAELLRAAQEICSHAYAPYSKFSVGCAMLLANGLIVTGSNQENMAYPSGLCAERVAMFYANSQYPDSPIVAIAICSKLAGEFNERAVFPCGACRQALLETEMRGKTPIKLIMAGCTEIKTVESVADLLPLSFSL